MRQDQPIRTAWDEEKEEWYFSVVDVVGVLTESVDATGYWRKLKQRLKKEGNETVTNCLHSEASHFCGALLFGSCFIFLFILRRRHTSMFFEQPTEIQSVLVSNNV